MKISRSQRAPGIALAHGISDSQRCTPSTGTSRFNSLRCWPKPSEWRRSPSSARRRLRLTIWSMTKSRPSSRICPGKEHLLFEIGLSSWSSTTPGRGRRKSPVPVFEDRFAQLSLVLEPRVSGRTSSHGHDVAPPTTNSRNMMSHNHVGLSTEPASETIRRRNGCQLSEQGCCPIYRGHRGHEEWRWQDRRSRRNTRLRQKSRNAW
jgi:hypothetical protein